MPFQITLCANEKCNNPVPPSKNPGVTRIYCSGRCGNRVAQRKYHAQENGHAGSGLYGMLFDQPYVRRKKAMNAAAAEERFKKHLHECAMADDDVCPARFDPYDKQRKCLIHAVLREDWDELRRKEAGRTWEREATTTNGFWIDAPVEIVQNPRFASPV